MRKATRKTKNLLDILHIGSSIGWLGMGLTQLTLNVVGMVTADQHLRHAVHEIAHVLDRYPLTIMAIVALVTGVLLGLKTKWGLVRYWWVLVKLVLTVLLIVTVPIWVGGWVLEAIDLTARGATPADLTYLVVRRELMASSVAIVSTLVFMLVISVVKPWKRVRRQPLRSVQAESAG